MKTIPLSLFVSCVMVPGAAIAQTVGAPTQEGDAKRSPQRPFADFWKSVDKDHDGSISKEEFGSLPRIQNLPEDKRGNLFSRLDKDADGKLSREEIGQMMRQHEGGDKPMQRLWELDTDKSGGVSFEEFKAGGPFSKLPPDKQEALFHHLDTDGDGMITPKDRPQPPFKRDDGQNLHPRRPEAGPHDGGPRMEPGAPRMEPRQILRMLDKDGDGALSFEEFRAGPMEKNLTEDEQEKHFQAFDKNHDLKLTADELPAPPPRGEPKPPQGPPPEAR